jgi:GTPase SAR1 family protein
MKALAQSGRGLSTFINRFVRNRYQSKRRKDDGSAPISV